MKEIYDLAAEYHSAGNNCVESVVKACNKGLDLNLPDAAIRMISGMGGGIGRSGCVCAVYSLWTGKKSFRFWMMFGAVTLALLSIY